MSIRNLPIRRKVIAIILLASALTLGLAVAGLVVYETTTVRTRVIRDMGSLSSLIGVNSAASLVFGDTIAGHENLATLAARPEIGAAALYDSSGQVFAGYRRRGTDAALPAVAPPSRPVVDGRHIRVTEPVTSGGQVIGSLSLRYDLPPLWQRLPQYTAVVLTVLLVLLSVGVLLSWLMESAVSRPLTALAATAREVRERKDYGLRAAKDTDDDIGRVTDAFNEMLDAIEQRDRALRASAARLDEAMAASNMTSWAWHVPSGQFTWAGGEARIFGPDARPVALTLGAFLDVIHPADRLAVQTALSRGAGERTPIDVDFRTVAADGRVRWLALRGHASAGTPVSQVLGFVQDVTERRHLEDQLIQSQKMEAIGRLAGGIAHDFNNLLTAILGYARFAAAGVPAGSPAQADILQIEQAGARAAALTGQLLAYARRQMIAPRLTDPNDLVRNMQSLLERLLGEDVRLVTRCAPDLWPAKVDPGQFEQVILNLAVNARDAMAGGGVLTIETANTVIDENFARSETEVTAGEYSAVTVSDTGSGMDATTQARVFDPFFTTKEQGKGTGLGLAVCYGIVKQAGGHITVSSEPGHGARFTVYLPRAADGAAAESSPAAPHESAPTGTETVLVVEDDALVRGLAVRTLRELGYRVLEATDGAAAIAAAAAHQGTIALLVTDVVMPGMNGKQVASRICEDRPGLRVIYMSGYTEHAVVQQGVLDEGIAFLQKPFDPARLARIVRAVLDGVRETPSPEAAQPDAFDARPR